jgi:hypothetical protein
MAFQAEGLELLGLLTQLMCSHAVGPAVQGPRSMGIGSYQSRACPLCRTLYLSGRPVLVVPIVYVPAPDSPGTNPQHI